MLNMVMLKPGQALNSALCLLVLLLAGSNELNPAAEAFSCSGNGTRQQVSLQFKRSGCLDWGVGGGQPNLGNACILGKNGTAFHP